MARFHRRMRGAVEHATRESRAHSRSRVVLDRIASRGRSYRVLALLALGALLLVGGVAIAGPGGTIDSSSGNTHGIAKAGPVNPVDGFPDWYADTNSVELEGCIDARDPNCGAVPTPDPTTAPSFPGNYPDEFFYMLADANLVSSGGGKVLAEFGLEGAFANGKIVTGDQMVFSRIRYRISSGVQAGAQYTITHPYGVDVVTPVADSPALFVTQDVGAVVGAFNEVLNGRVGPFLTWDTYGLPVDQGGPPAGYIGDGATAHKVKGSTLGTNFVKIEGPGIGGTNNPNPCPGLAADTSPDCIYTDLFTVVGKKSTRAGVSVARATYSRSADSLTTQIDAFAESKAGQTIVLHAPNGEFPDTNMAIEGTRYWAHVDSSGKPLPATVQVINKTDVPATVKTVKVTDLVTAQVNLEPPVPPATTGTMHILASSSDLSSPPPSLTLPDFGDKVLAAAPAPATGVHDHMQFTAPPETLTVQSSAGGSVTVHVDIKQGMPMNPIPLKAIATVNPNPVDQGVTVTLDSSSSTGNITARTWSGTGPDGQPVDFGSSDPTATKVTYVPLLSGTYTFKVAVTGPAGSPPVTTTDTATVDLVVNEVSTPVARIAPMSATQPQNWPITLDGSGSTGSNYTWSYVGGLPAGAPLITFPNGTNGQTLSFTFPKTENKLTFALKVCNLQNTICSPASIDLAGAHVTLTARVRLKGGRWQIAGTDDSKVADLVTVRTADGNQPGTVVNTAVPDATGAWQIDMKGSTLTANTVNITSDRGGNLPGQAVAR